jgi:hypothetical protein
MQRNMMEGSVVSLEEQSHQFAILAAWYDAIVARRRRACESAANLKLNFTRADFRS